MGQHVPDPTLQPIVTDILFMGMENETAVYEAYNTLKKGDKLNSKTTVHEFCSIFLRLLKDGFIEMWLGDPYILKPVSSDNRNLETLLTAENISFLVDNSDGVLVYETTDRGTAVVKQEWRRQLAAQHSVDKNNQDCSTP